jgi:hypothetical protein
MVESVKAGARCECTGAPCSKGEHVSKLADDRCLCEAVCMVTVERESKSFRRDIPQGEYGSDSNPCNVRKAVPMCAACAEWHENHSAKRSEVGV